MRPGRRPVPGTAVLAASASDERAGVEPPCLVVVVLWSSLPSAHSVSWGQGPSRRRLVVRSARAPIRPSAA
jgi:hypothetical protein